jgi:hypothetical protein
MLLQHLLLMRQLQCREVQAPGAAYTLLCWTQLLLLLLCWVLLLLWPGRGQAAVVVAAATAAAARRAACLVRMALVVLHT